MADPGALDENLELFAQLLKHRWEAGKHNGIRRAAVEEWVLEAEDPVDEEQPLNEPFVEDTVIEETVVAAAIEETVAAAPIEETLRERPIVEEQILEEQTGAAQTVEAQTVEAQTDEEQSVEELIAAESFTEEPVSEEPLPEPAPLSNPSEYVVQRKDNLWKIARNWLTTQLDHEPSNIEIWQAVFAIARENEIEDVKIIHPSTILRIPDEFVYDSAD